jgi:hypothetical protein
MQINLSKKVLGAVLIVVIVGASILSYSWFFPPLELKIINAEFSPFVTACYNLVYSVSYTNHGVFDLTISGEIQTKIEGFRTIEEKPIIQPRFLLRVGETSSWTIPASLYCETELMPGNDLNIRLEAIAFLRINGMERTLTANYQFIGP